MYHPAPEPTTWEIRASFSRKRNVALARAVHGILTWTSYDPWAAHRWALKLIASDPQSGEDAAVCLVNFPHMVDGVRVAYATNHFERDRYDRTFSAFAEWKAKASEPVVA